MSWNFSSHNAVEAMDAEEAAQPLAVLKRSTNKSGSFQDFTNTPKR